jgi:hypothetical protein
MVIAVVVVTEDGPPKCLTFCKCSAPSSRFLTESWFSACSVVYGKRYLRDTNVSAACPGTYSVQIPYTCERKRYTSYRSRFSPPLTPATPRSWSQPYDADLSLPASLGAEAGQRQNQEGLASIPYSRWIRPIHLVASRSCSQRALGS